MAAADYDLDSELFCVVFPHRVLGLDFGLNVLRRRLKIFIFTFEHWETELHATGEYFFTAQSSVKYMRWPDTVHCFRYIVYCNYIFANCSREGNTNFFNIT